MDLHNIIKLFGNKSKSKRIGRGIGSGKGGHTVGKGHKGQKARSGNKHLAGFEGGQVPLYKRLPQMGGFKNPSKKNVLSISLNNLNVFRANSTVTPKDLVTKNVLKELPKKSFVKILGDGTLEKKLTLKGFLYSKTAKDALEKAGCELQA